MAAQGKQPRGDLTGAQFELLGVIWSAGEAGIGIGQMWEEFRERRGIVRSTVQNQIERLARRGWLVRRGSGDATGCLYTVALDRRQTVARMVETFVRDFFQGDAVELVMGLIGGGVDDEELRRLRTLIEHADSLRSHTIRGGGKR